MANRPANAGPGSVGPGSVGSPVHHDAPPATPHVIPRAAAPQAAPPRAPSGHRASRPRPSADRAEPAAGRLSWLPYLLVLAGVAIGMFVAGLRPAYALGGVAVVGCSLLAAALARLTLPTRWAGLLASRRKASDVLAFAVLGAAVLAVALTLP